MNTIILCARQQSTRLPGKALIKIAGKPILQHIVERYQASTRIDKIIVASPRADARIAALCDQVGVDWHGGSENDVVKRMDGALRQYAPSTDYVFRGLGDMPLFDVSLLDWRLDLLRRRDADVVWCGLKGEPWPVYGSRESPWSRRAWDAIVENSEGSDREHAGQWLYNRMRQFRVIYTEGPLDEYYDSVRFELDTSIDLEFFNRIYNALHEGPGTPTTLVVLRWLRTRPDVARINAGVEEKTLTRIGWHKMRGTAWACEVCGAEPMQTGFIKRGKLMTECRGCGAERAFVEVPRFLAGKR